MIDLSFRPDEILALLPVRLETRFTDDGGALRVRIYPDDMHLYHTDPVVARGLPDRFVAVVWQTGQPATATGEPVPARLPVAPAAAAAEQWRALDGLPLAAGTEWLYDYAAAEQVGMAVTVPLPRPGQGVDRLVVTGVRGGDAAPVLEELLAAHRESSGVELLAIGTPTNNTETARSPWRRTSGPAAGPELSTPDGMELAAALGLPDRVFRGVLGPARDAQRDARAVHTVLWSNTLGGFIAETLRWKDGHVSVSDAQREALRDLFQDTVRGRGPLPSLRIGRQPYGFLPAVSLDRLAPDPGDPLEPALHRILLGARNLLREAIPGLPAMPGAADAAGTLMEILGSAPTCMGVRERSVISDQTINLMDSLNAGAVNPADDQLALQNRVTELLGLTVGNKGNATFAKVSAPLRLPLAADDDAAYIEAVRNRSHGDPRSILQMLVALAWEDERVDDNRDPALPTADKLHEVPLPEAAYPALGRLLGQLIGPPDPEGLGEVADAFAEAFGHAGPSKLASYRPFGVHTSFRHLAEQQPDPAVRAHLNADWLQARARAEFRFHRFERALTEVATMSTEDRRMAVGEALDCCSHRFDAWATAFATRRLRALRTSGRYGVTLGAYGWVESIPARGMGPRPGGYIHAPSLAQAATAGIMRSANVANEGNGAFAFDLSSGRVRTALRLLDGVRQGQPVGAVLGYLIERRLHERTLDRFVLSLRRFAPLISGQLTEAAREAEATVVDGVALIEASAVDWGMVRLALSSPPDNPYLPPDSWVPPSDGDWTVITEIVAEARSSYDALADLLVAEGVHQLAEHNLDRAAAALDLAAGSGTVSVDPEVVRTSTRGIPVTHRDLLLCPVDGPAEPDWNPDRPRALAEPRLERWAAAHLGPATEIAAGDGTLADRGVCALDVVYDGADLPLPPRIVGLARSLYRLLAASRPVLPADLVPSGVDATRTVATGELRARLSAAASALSGGDAQVAGDTLEELLDAARTMFGDDFRVLPLIEPGPEVFPTVQVGQSAIRRFLRDLATVRPGIARHAEILLLADAARRPNPLRVAQSGPAAGWVGVPFDPNDPGPQRPVTSLVIDGPDGAGTVAGLVLDEWQEVLPRRIESTEDGVVSTVTSGLAINANGPGARAPQAVLLAVSPTGQQWSGDDLLATLTETLELAKLRAVTLERSFWLGWVLPAIILPTWTKNQEPVIDLDALRATANHTAIPFVKD